MSTGEAAQAAGAKGPQPDVASVQADVKELLKVQKGSRAVPFFLLIVSTIGFIIYGLSTIGTRDALTERFQMACQSVRDAAGAAAKAIEAAAKDPPAATQEQKEAAEATAKQLQDRQLSRLGRECATANGRKVAELTTEFRNTSHFATSNQIEGFATGEVGGWSGVLVVIAAAIRESLEILWVAMVQYWKGAVWMAVSAAAFALLPGLAGLIYRRNFWGWFGVGFAGLLAIHIVASSLSRMFGLYVDTANKVMPGSGIADPTRDPAVIDLAANITTVFLVQLCILILAFRLRRHAAKPPVITRFISSGLYNKLLFWLLLLVGVDLFLNFTGSHTLWDRLWATLPFNDSVEFWNFLLFGLPFLYAILKISETWSGKKQKNVVICLDGTSNTPDQLEMGFIAQTNVFKLFRMLKADKRGTFNPAGQFDATLCKIYDDRQVALYFTGIGNKYENDPLIGTISQATGLGATGIIERAYLDLIRVWRPGDRVFIVGFSRGAASARILSRMIDERGAPNSIWTLQLFGRHWTFWPSKRKNPVTVNVLGCWDTVGSFGIAKTFAGVNFQQLNLLHDMSIPDNVAKAYHMVALDEDRMEFEPTLMEPDPIRPARVIEVWFPGTHAGVGGGWATDRLSDVPLDFLLRHVSSGYSADAKSTPGEETWGLYLSAINGIAEQTAANGSGTGSNGAAPGLSLADEVSSVRQVRAGDIMRIYPDPRGQLRVWISKMYTYRPRKLPLHAVISETVFDRMVSSEPVYAPQSLFDLNDALDAKRDLICEKVEKLDETKSLDATEREAVIGFANKLKLTRWPQYRERIHPEPVGSALANPEGMASVAAKTAAVPG